jgi:hypothetical protein
MDDGERANALIKLLSSAWVHTVRTGLAQLKEAVNFKCVHKILECVCKQCVHARSCLIEMNL